MIFRTLSYAVQEDLELFPAVAIIGPRQVGKTTLAKSLGKRLEKQVLYLDLESDIDLAKLANAETYLLSHADKCVVIDEVQIMPRLFPLLRSLIDRRREPGRFVLLGSASPELIRESLESLAGRIAFHELTPFSLTEVTPGHELRDHWLRGGFPEAFLAKSLRGSNRWLENFAKTFVERDLRNIIGFDIDPQTMNRFIRMIANLHGQNFNIAEIARSMDLSVPTVNKYLHVLEGSFFMIRLEPYFRNLTKRLVKSPKHYFRDSGFLHSIVRIPDMEALYTSPLLGASWEGYVIEQIRRIAGNQWNYFFYRTNQGAEIDLLLETPAGKFVAIEIKYSNTPTISKGFYQSCEDLKPDYKFVITPDSDSYLRDENVRVCSLLHFLINEIRGLA